MITTRITEPLNPFLPTNAIIRIRCCFLERNNGYEYLFYGACVEQALVQLQRPQTFLLKLHKLVLCVNIL